MPAERPAADSPAPAYRVLDYTEGLLADGSPSQLWTAMVRRLRGNDAPPLVAVPLTTDQAAWAALIKSRMAGWEGEIPLLAQNFGPDEPAPAASIVVGNQGGEDAFTAGAGTIGFDVERLLANYGRADMDENRDRIDRFFRHEYVHLLQKRWLERRPYWPRTPVERALLGMWTEGLGNLYSLSDRWRGHDSALSDQARAALDRLSPRLVDRMIALRCADASEAGRLLADLSFGPFDQKWGALPVALWLEAEARRSPGALRDFIDAGPAGTWDFLVRNLPGPSQKRLVQAFEVAETCTARSGQAPGMESPPHQ